MDYIIEKYKNFMIAYEHGFKTNVLTVVLYALLSTFWILASDSIVNSICTNSAMNERVQSLKGLFFVVMTSVFLLVLLWKNYNTIVQFREAYEKSEDELREFKTETQQKTALYQLMTSYLLDDAMDSDEIFVDIFHYIFNRIEVCDLGSVYKLEKDNVQFIDAVGYDLDLLNSMDISPEKFLFYTFSLKKNVDTEGVIEKKLGPDKYKEYSSKNPRTYESIYIGLTEDEETRTGISLDISESAWESGKKTFDDCAINELKELQILLSAMFRMKSMVGIKNLLQRDIVNSFIAALEHHDEYTKGHSESVSNISLEIGKKLGLDKNDLQELSWAAMVHDIGKIIIPDTILNKRGSLTDAEFDIVKKHATTGESILSKSESLNDIAKYVRHHHERWDGKGYPDGLAGEEIPFYSRIICVADTYHAMTSDRPYRKGLGIDKALEEIRINKAKQFCPRVVDAFMSSLDE